MNEINISALQCRCDALIEAQQTLMMATRSPAGEADISYAPFVRHQGRFYIFISELARHTQNLLAHPLASVLFIEPEAEAANLFARQRLTLRCRVEVVAVDDAEYLPRLQQLTDKFGETVTLLTSLPDFHLMTLIPVEGVFVAGFGKAIAVDAEGRLIGQTGR